MITSHHALSDTHFLLPFAYSQKIHGVNAARILRSRATSLTFPSFALPQGKHAIILGPSGCGKSTLLHLLAAILAPQHVPPPSAPAVPTLQQLPKLPGVVSWNMLTKINQVKAKDRILLEFTKEITALNDKEVRLQSFMTPLEPGEKQKHFLISVTPQTCSLCLPTGPEGVVEVKTKTSVKYTFEPVVVIGQISQTSLDAYLKTYDYVRLRGFAVTFML